MPERPKSSSEREADVESGEREIESPKYPEKRKTAEERRDTRERIGKEVSEKYLEPQEDDSERVRDLKEQIKDKDLDETIGVLIDTDDPAKIADAMETLGISRSQKETKTGKIVEQWRLKNPDPEMKGKHPGSFANPEYLKAFLAGFAGAETFNDQVQVIHEIYEYLDLEPPELEELVEDKDEQNPTPANPPLKKWKTVFGSLKKSARMVTLAAGMITAIVAMGGRRNGEYQGGEITGESSIEMVVDDTGGAEKESDAEQESTIVVLEQGDTVYDIVKEQLGERGEDKDLLDQMVKEVLNDNDIADADFGTEGTFDSKDLDVGTSLDVGGVARKIVELNQIDSIRGDIENL